MAGSSWQPAGYHIILLHCRSAEEYQLGRAGHITLESLLRDPSPLEATRGTRTHPSAIRELVLTLQHCIAWRPIAPLLSTSRFAPKCIFFAEKEQLLQPLVDVDIVKMRKTPRIVFALPPAAAGRGVAFLQFRFYALFTFLLLLPRNLPLL